MPGSWLLYFDYGRNLGRDAFESRVDGAEWLGLARLEDHRISTGPGGRLNARPTEGSTVWGSLWMIPAERLEWLDADAVDASAGFLRTTGRIVSPAGPRTEAMLYRSDDARAEPCAAEEISRLSATARKLRVPSAYVGEVESLVG